MAGLVKLLLRYVTNTIIQPLGLWLRRPLLEAAPRGSRLRLYSLLLLLVALSSPVLHPYMNIALTRGELLVHTLIVTTAVALVILLLEAAIAALRRAIRQANSVSNGGLLLRATAAYLLASPAVGLFHQASPFTRAIMEEHDRAAPASMAWHVLPVVLFIVYVWYQAARKEHLSRQVASLQRINDELAQREHGGQHDRSGDGPARPTPAVTVRSNGMALPLRAESILRVESDENYCHIVAAGGDGRTNRYMERMTLRDALETLPDQLFLQTHRSHLVNLRCVAELIRDGRRRQLRLTNGDRVPVSRARIDAVQSRIGEFLAGHGSPAATRDRAQGVQRRPRRECRQYS